MKIEVIPSKHWQHVNGRRASIYGSAPWAGQADKPNWTLVESGYTWKVTESSGTSTIGLCRPTANTFQDALEIARQWADVTGGRVVE